MIFGDFEILVNIESRFCQNRAFQVFLGTFLIKSEVVLSQCFFSTSSSTNMESLREILRGL